MQFPVNSPLLVRRKFAVPTFSPRLCSPFLAKLLTTRVSAGRILFWCERIGDRLKAWIAS
jgi:hypothetical protein